MQVNTETTGAKTARGHMMPSPVHLSDNYPL